MRKWILLLAAVMMAAGLEAQQLPVYSQYLFNKYLINPAVAGSDGYTSINLTTRQQWAGYQGAPQTYSLSAQGRILKQKYLIRDNIFDKKIFKPHTEGKVGVGATVFSDINGLVRRTGSSTSYAYHIWLHGGTQLSFGLAFTGYHYKIDQRQIQFDDPDEPWLNTDFRKGIFVPDFNFGAYLLDRKFAIGFSVQDMMEGFIKAGSQAYRDLKIQRTYYLFGNYDFEPDNKSLIQPSLLLKMSEQLSPQADIGITYSYDNKIWVGATFRTGSAIIANVGVRRDRLFFGYSFDFTLQSIQMSTYGSHEFIMAVRFGDTPRKYRWLDRY
ncbi:MAG: type IX secretion system membrane protein PorP/SprF [Bacteroidales bacterium]|nr:type IX secretion system membrane protein PorP/SprF [Bacteroidales bacterium]MDT8373318.1 type IX secretion system membrane protein PorP/SprF [Bacteroidales bacterium]